jgi:hypothetical protein
MSIKYDEVNVYSLDSKTKGYIVCNVTQLPKPIQPSIEFMFTSMEKDENCDFYSFDISDQQHTIYGYCCRFKINGERFVILCDDRETIDALIDDFDRYGSNLLNCAAILQCNHW